MKLKGIKTIALLAAAILLVIGSVAGIAAAGAGDSAGDEEFEWNWDACYWWGWDGLELPLYQRKQVRDILVLILDTYFGIDISRMTSEEMDEVGRLIGYDGQEKVLRLFEHYAHKKGFEMPEPPEPPAPLPVEPEPYWWEIVGDPEGEVEAIMKQVAEAKGMSPDEVRERFCELFPGVDLWSMTFWEFDQFLDSLPRPPLKWGPVCFEELGRNPSIIGLFGRVPVFSTHQELEEFNRKLEEVTVAVAPLLRQLCRSEFPFVSAVISQGAISIGVYTDRLPNAREVYQMIAEKAERLFGIENVPATFSNAVGTGPADFDPPPGPASSGWEAPWNEPFCPIPGAVKVTAGDYHWCTTTASFAVQRRTLWRYDEDYIVSGHKGPGITPVRMRIYQPTPGHEAGEVKDNVATHTYADAARVGISDARVRPYILIGGSPSQPALRPVFGSADPPLPPPQSVIWISAGRTGVTFSVDVLERRTFTNSGPYEELRDQVIVRPRVHLPGTMGGDSGSPYWLPVWDPVRRMHGAKIHGLHVGTIPVNGVDYADGVDLMVLSPVSGVEGEFPGWRVWVRE
ncbi:hypothetical protein M1O12_04440 [Dehalococcoidia bacterium]|nr:hypothetical protein [Dehalococcoidia bacterium]